jgi:hypothetical protein
MTSELLSRIPADFGLGNENHVRFVREQSSDPRSQERVVVDGQKPNLRLAHVHRLGSFCIAKPLAGG